MMLISRRMYALLLITAIPLAAFASSYAFRPDTYLGHVKYLASDDLAGRGNGTPELELAAKYIADHFKTRGLQPAGDAGRTFRSSCWRSAANSVRGTS